MQNQSLEAIAQSLVATAKGILAADESTGTIKKRFDKIGVESTEETRQAYRELLFTAPETEQYISGVILYDETIRQSSKDGVPFPKVLSDRGIISGIKVDMGTEPFAGSPVELQTKGLDGLPARLAEYYAMGARFAKWRGVYTITDTLPSDGCIEENAKRLVEYAKMCQNANIVPIVEPEVLMDGTHTIERCYDVTTRVLHQVFSALKEKGVLLSGMLLKPNMILAGEASDTAFDAEQIAEYTLRCLNESVPHDVPGIVFLSGGQSEEEACATLQAMNAKGKQPWELSFSYGRALQSSTLKAWLGRPENVPAAQAAFARRARLVSAARMGTYNASME